MTRRYTLGTICRPVFSATKLFELLDHGVFCGAYVAAVAVFDISDDCEITGGNFFGGWLFGGTFTSGTFYGGEFNGGNFFGGAYYGGEFNSGGFKRGTFYGGTFEGGIYTTAGCDYFTALFNSKGNSIPTMNYYLSNRQVRGVYPLWVSDTS